MKEEQNNKKNNRAIDKLIQAEDKLRDLFWKNFKLLDKCSIENNAEYSLKDLRYIIGKPADYWLCDNSPAGYSMLFDLNRDNASLTLVRFIESDGVYSLYHYGYIEIPHTLAGFPVTRIGNYAFYNCKKIRTIIVPNNVTAIEDYSFQDCSSLVKVTLPKSLKEIGNYAFANCVVLEYINLPDSITNIGMSPFEGCELLDLRKAYQDLFPKADEQTINKMIDYTKSEIDIFPDDDFWEVEGLYKIKNGLFSSLKIHYNGYSLRFHLINNNTCLSLCGFEKEPKYVYGRLDIYIPSIVEGYPVTQIEKTTFIKEGETLSGIEVPEFVTHIDEGCFDTCEILDYINVDKHNPKYDSRNNCKAIIQTDTNTLITGCSLTKIPSSVVKIGNKAFYNRHDLIDIIIPDSVTEIGQSAFEGCRDLFSIEIPQGVTKINNQTFASCSCLKSVILPDTIEEIGKGAFRFCEDLKQINIPHKVKKIGNSAFFACSELSEVSIPDSVCELGESAFCNCINLTTIDIPDSVKKIDNSAFVNCKNLSSIHIPKSLIDIGNDIMWGCSGITSISVDHDNPIYDSRHNCNAIIDTATNKLLRGCRNTIIPNSVKTIGIGAFSYCDKLIRIQIPSSVTSIENNAFFSCSNLKEVIIPNSVKHIGYNVFSECECLERIIISDTSLLKESGIPENVAIEYSYEDLEEYLDKNNLGDSSDPEYVRLVSLIPFTKINNYFSDQLDKKNPKYYNQALLSSMLEYKNPLMHINFGFIKYIHIYNNIGKHQIGSINLYIDFTHGIITSDRNEVYARNMVFDDFSLIDLLKTNHMALMGGVIAECCQSTNDEVLDAIYNPVINVNSKDDGDILSGYIKQFFQVDYEKLIGYISKLYPDKNDDIITNYYYLGNYGERFDRDYALWANIGIDITHVSNKECIKTFLETFRQFLSRLSTNLQFGGVRTNEMHQKAVESATAQSDLRNSSHNLGAHVLARFDANNYTTDEINLFVRSYLGRSLNYLGEKSFGAPEMMTTKMLYGDIMSEFEKQKILLDNISGVADFRPHFNILYNGQPLSYENDIPVAMPADVYGIMALYNIASNVIRNTAKHCVNTDNETSFTIEFSDSNNDVPSEYYCVEIDNGVKEKDIDDLVKKMNKHINESVLDKNTFKLRDHNLGLVEMSSSAAFLRKLDSTCIDSYDYRFDDIDDIYNKEGNLIIFKAINKNGCLAYRFYVFKARNFLFLGNWSEIEKQNDRLNYGIQFIEEAKFAESMKNGISFPQQFVIYKDKISKSTKALLSNDNNCKTLLPLRKISVTSREARFLTNVFNNNVNKDVISELSDFAWTHHCNATNNLYIGRTPNIKKLNSFNQIVFINHGNETTHTGVVNLNTGNHKLWVENLSSYTERKLPLYAELSVIKTEEDEGLEPFQAYLRHINNHVKCELYEAYNNKVIVIDERIQDFSNKSTEGSSISCSALFKSTNVLIPDAPLDPIFFDDKSIEDIIDFVGKNLKDAFILVHYGILERMYKRNVKIIKDILENWSKIAKRVVVTSGRGSHSLDLPDSVCYTNLSSALYAFKENRNKYLINYLLNQSRRKDV